MKLLRNKLIVKFDTEHSTQIGVGIGGLAIIRPDKWESDDSIAKNQKAEQLLQKANNTIEANSKSYRMNEGHRNSVTGSMYQAVEEANAAIDEAEASTTRFEENENYLETNPQICTVIHSSAHHPYKVGDKLFVNYLAWEWREKTEDGHLIEADSVFFVIGTDGSLSMEPHTYLGEAIYAEDVVTTSGILLSSGKKDNLRVRITHIPPNSDFEVGDTIVSIDKNNYELTYQGKKYVKITTDEIVGVIW